MRWINAKERLPDTDECVLVIASGKYKNIELVDAYELANYFSGCGWCMDAYPDMEDLSITWWMYLPDPPKVDPEILRPHGRWVSVEGGSFYEYSNCGHLTEYHLSNYCPNCGAKMDKEMLESEVAE